jgi:hypothetical protein
MAQTAVNYRYIQWAQGTSSNTDGGSGYGAPFVAIQAYVGATNVALDVVPTFIVNGTVAQGSLAELTTASAPSNVAGGLYTDGPSTIQLDLGAGGQPLTGITIWPAYGAGTATWMNGIQVSLSTDGQSWITAYGPTNVNTATGYSATVGINVSIPITCFVAGTPIATPRGGERAVESFVAGDLVRSSDGRAVRVTATSHTQCDAATVGAMGRPVRIPRGVLGATRDLLVSPRHGVVVDGVLVAAYNVPLAQRDAVTEGTVHYHHLVLEDDSAMLVASGGVACESLRF